MPELQCRGCKDELMLGAPAKTEDAMVRRSARTTKKQVISAPSSSESDDSGSEMEAEFELKVSPTKITDASVPRRPTSDDPSCSGKDIYEQLCAKGAAMKLAVDEWTQQFGTHQTAAILQLINTIIWTGTIQVDLELQAFSGEEEPSEILSAFQDSLDSSVLGPQMLIGKKKGAQQFQRSFGDFWSKWAQSVYVNLADANARLNGRFIPWLVLLSTSQFRPLRQAASLSCFAILVGLAKASGELSAQLEKATRITKNAIAGSGLVDGLTAQLAAVEKTIQHLFSTVYIQRFRDVDKDIRRVALEQLGTMIQAQPGLFLDNHYLRYLGWGLSDKHAEVRLAAVESLGSLYRDKSYHAPMNAFTERFKDRLAAMAYRDIDEDVRGAAQSLVLRLFHSDFIQLNELKFVDKLASAMVPLSKEGAALLFARCFAAAQEESDTSLLAALNAYVDDMTMGRTSAKKLRFIEYVVTALAPSVPWLSDVQQALQHQLSWPLLEAVFRNTIYSSGTTRVTPTRPSGLEASTRLSEAAVTSVIESLSASEDDLTLLSLFEIVTLLDPNSGPSASLTDAVIAAFSSSTSLDEGVLSAGVSAFRFLRACPHLTSRVDSALEHMAKDQIALAFRNVNEETTDVRAALLKAALIGGLIRPIEDGATETNLLSTLAFSSPPNYEGKSCIEPSIFGCVLRLLYQHLLWRLSDQKSADTPVYTQVIPLRDELLSACRQKCRTSFLVALDLLFLFSPTQEWMSETWRLPASQDLSDLIQSIDELASSDETLAVGLTRLAASGYDSSFQAAAIPIKWFCYFHEERMAPAIDHIKRTVDTGVLAKALTKGILDASLLLLDDNSPVYEAIEASPVLAKNLGTHLKRASDLAEHVDSILALHRGILALVVEHAGNNQLVEQVNAVAQIAAHYTSLLPPSTDLDLDSARSKLGRGSTYEHVRNYLKALEKHTKKAATGRRLQLTPQKRKARLALGGSALKQSHSALIEPKFGSEDDEEEVPNLMDALEDEEPSSELALETNAFKQLTIANENEEEATVGIPLRKKQILRT